MASALAPSCVAQTAPDTGRLIQDQQRITLPGQVRLPAGPVPDQPPAVAAPRADAQRVRVTAFRFSRNSALAHAALEALLADLVGQQLTLAELHAAADRITAHYRQHAYFIARACLPRTSATASST